MFYQDKPFQLVTALEQIFTSMAPEAGEQGLSFELLIDEEVPNNVSGDMYKLKTAIKELVVNAMKFTNRGGIKICVTHRQTENDMALVRFAVVDSGIGIPKDRLNEILTDIRTNNLSHIHQFNQNGYDLREIHHLVQMFGAKNFTITTEHNVGTKVTFEAPLRVVPAMIQADGTQPEKVQPAAL